MNLVPFQHDKIRKIWHKEQWFFSIVDIISVLVDQDNFQIARKYWNKLSERLKKEGSQLVTNCHQLKMIAQDGKMRETDCASIETVFRLVQSVPSPKAEPLKLWLAKVGTERVSEIQDPSLGINRVRELWKKHGRSEKWIQQRMMGQETRNKLTDYWKSADVKEGDEYAILTNIIHQEWADISVSDHKKLKNLNKTNNLRDHMSEAELILTALSEITTRQTAETMQAKGFEQNKIPAQQGGQVAKIARKAMELRTNKNVVTGENFLGNNKNKKIK